MGCKLGSTGFTALRSVAWPLGIASEVDTLPAIRTGMLYLLRQQSSTPPQSANKRISPESEPIEVTMLATHCVAALVLVIGNHQPYKQLDTAAELESLRAHGRPNFEFQLCEAFRCHTYRVQETDQGARSVIQRLCAKRTTNTGDTFRGNFRT